jgi:Zinc finger, C2H2 type
MQSVPGSIPCYTQLPHVVPSRLKDRIANIATKVSASKRSAHDVHWLCPICSAPLSRSQDRKRHILSHLPHWLQCPDPGCSWRGDRWENLNKHRRRLHRHNVHPSGTQESDKSNSLIYDPWPLVQGITEGRTPIEAARVISISMVERRASELGKSMLWGDFWGRRGRKAQRLGGFIVNRTKCRSWTRRSED